MHTFAGSAGMARHGGRQAWGWVRKGSTTNRRLDKRGSPVEPQAIEMACVSACRSVGERAAPWIFSHEFNDAPGTVCQSGLSEDPS